MGDGTGFDPPDSVGINGSEVVDGIRLHPRDVQFSKFEKYSAFAEIIYKNPEGLTKTEILTGLKDIVSGRDFDPIDDFFEDNGIIRGGRAKRTKNDKIVWDYVYMPDEERDINSVKRYLESRFK